MEVIYILLPTALLFAAFAVLVFGWATRSGQFDDLETPASRILGDDPVPPRDKRGSGNARDPSLGLAVGVDSVPRGRDAGDV